MSPLASAGWGLEKALGYSLARQGRNGDDGEGCATDAHGSDGADAPAPVTAEFVIRESTPDASAASFEEVSRRTAESFVAAVAPHLP